MAYEVTKTELQAMIDQGIGNLNALRNAINAINDVNVMRPELDRAYAYIAELESELNRYRAMVAQKDSTIANLRVEVAALTAEVARLEELLGIDTGTIPLRFAVWSDHLARKWGINAHLNNRSTAWGMAPGWKAKIKALKLRKMRTLIGSQAAAIADAKEMVAAGMRLTVTVATPRVVNGVNPTYDHAEVIRYIKVLEQAGIIEGLDKVEGGNEANHPAATAGWALRLRSLQQVIWDTVKGSTILKNVVVLGPSPWGRRPEDIAQMGDMSEVAQGASLHYYVAGYQPSQGHYGEPIRLVPLDQVIEDHKAMVPGSPTVSVTEAGVATAEAAGIDAYNVPEDVQSRHGIRMMFLLSGRPDVDEVLWYGGMDKEGTIPQHGVLDQSGTGSATTYREREIYWALQKTMALLNDIGPDHVPVGLRYKITGPTGLYELLLEKRDGRHLIALWREQPLWNRDAKTRITVPPVNYTLELAAPARVMRHNIHGANVDLGSHSTFTVPVGAEVSILEVGYKGLPNEPDEPDEPTDPDPQTYAATLGFYSCCKPGGVNMPAFDTLLREADHTTGMGDIHYLDGTGQKGLDDANRGKHGALIQSGKCDLNHDDHDTTSGWAHELVTSSSGLTMARVQEINRAFSNRFVPTRPYVFPLITDPHDTRRIYSKMPILVHYTLDRRTKRRHEVQAYNAAQRAAFEAELARVSAAGGFMILTQGGPMSFHEFYMSDQNWLGDQIKAKGMIGRILGTCGDAHSGQLTDGRDLLIGSSRDVPFPQFSCGGIFSTSGPSYKGTNLWSHGKYTAVVSGGNSVAGLVKLSYEEGSDDLRADCILIGGASGGPLKKPDGSPAMMPLVLSRKGWRPAVGGTTPIPAFLQ